MLCMSQIKEFIKTSSMDVSGQRSCPLLEMMWQSYTMHHPIESNKINENFEEVELLLEPLSRKRKLHILRLVTDLCVEHERAAFIEGIRVGGRLLLELEEGGDELMEEVRRMHI